MVWNPGMVRWPLSALGMDPSLRHGLWQEGGPNTWRGALQQGVCMAPPLPRGFVTSDVSKRHVLFFPSCFKNKQTTKKKEFLNLWSTQKGEAPAKGVLGTVPTRRGTRCLRGSFSHVPAPRWGRGGHWGHGSCSSPAAHHSWHLAR